MVKVEESDWIQDTIFGYRSEVTTSSTLVSQNQNST